MQNIDIKKITYGDIRGLISKKQEFFNKELFPLLYKNEIKLSVEELRDESLYDKTSSRVDKFEVERFLEIINNNNLKIDNSNTFKLCGIFFSKLQKIELITGCRDLEFVVESFKNQYDFK